MATMLKNLDHTAFGNPKFGNFWMGFKINFAEYPTGAVGDSYRIGKVRDGWLITESYWRMPTPSTQATSTIDVGFGAAGQTDIVSAINADGSYTGWQDGSILQNGGANLEIAADEHVVVTVDAAAIGDGILEVMFNVVAGISENEPADANIDD